MNVIGITGNAGAGKDSAADRLVAQHGFIKVSLADPLKRIARDVYAFTDDQLWGPSSSRNAPDKRYWVETATGPAPQAGPRGPAPAAKGPSWKCSRCSEFETNATPDCRVYLTARYALQILGTEWGRNCYENTWIDLALRTSGEVLEQGRCYTPQRGLYDDLSAPRPKGVAIADVRFWNELDGVKLVGGHLWRVKPPTPIVTGEAWRTHKSETEQGEIPDSRFDVLIVNAKVAFEVLYADVDAGLARCQQGA